MVEKTVKEILPAKGIWTVQDLASYLGLPPAVVQQKLSDLKIGVITFSSRYKHKLFRLEDLKAVEKEVHTDSDRVARRRLS